MFFVFGAVSVRKKDEILEGGFFVFPGLSNYCRHFYFMRGHSLVELTELDDSAADIMAYLVCVCVFIKLHITTQSGPVILVCVCVCVVCVFFPFILDFNGRTSRGHTGRR